MDTLIGLCGIGVLIGAAYLMSENRKAINWRLVGAGIGLQVILALLILKVPGTKEAFAALGHGIEKLLDCAVDGAAFVFGEELARGKYIFFVRIGSSIIFVASLASLAYYLGIMQRVVRGLARVLVKTMGISGPEALSAASAVFVGQVECQVLIKPYMAGLTRSELFCSMAAAMATISGSALIAYTGLGMNATYLIAASIMSAPAGILMAKIMIPESNTKALSASMDLAAPPAGANVFDAMVHGAMDGAKIVGSVMIMVLVAIASVSLINGSLAWAFSLFGTSLQIQDIFAVPMMPVAFLMGVPYHECFHVGRLMATEILVNEFVSYGELAKVIQGTGPYELSLKTQMIATFALCGFANLGSIAINIGGLGAMVPERRSEIAKLALRALIAANMGTWITAAIAGVLFSI
jgi:concentrative nucleoside transporter, CNT family